MAYWNSAQEVARLQYGTKQLQRQEKASIGEVAVGDTKNMGHQEVALRHGLGAPRLCCRDHLERRRGGVSLHYGKESDPSTNFHTLDRDCLSWLGVTEGDSSVEDALRSTT